MTYDADRTSGGFLDDVLEGLGLQKGHTEPADSVHFNASSVTPELEAKIRTVADTWATIEQKMAADPSLAKTLKGFHDDWISFSSSWQAGSKDVGRANAIIAETNTAADYAGIRAYNSPNAIKNFDIEEELKTGIRNDLQKNFCEGALPDQLSFICNVHSWRDIPGWVWGVGAAGVFGMGVLTYLSFRAAPYVLSVVPETAPVGRAWVLARQGETAPTTSVPNMGAQGVQDALAQFAARQDQAGKELRALLANAPVAYAR